MALVTEAMLYTHIEREGGEVFYGDNDTPRGKGRGPRGIWLGFQPAFKLKTY